MRPPRLVLMLLAASGFLLLTACDGSVYVEIVNPTDEDLRVELRAVDTYRSIDVVLRPGAVLVWSAVNISEFDYGQLRAFNEEGILVYERDYLLDTDRHYGCRIQLAGGVRPGLPVTCTPAFGSTDISEFVHVKNQTDGIIAVFLRGEFRGNLKPGREIVLALYDSETAAELKATLLDGRVIEERTLVPDDTPREIGIEWLGK